MKKKGIYIFLFVFGVTGGIFFSISRVRASSPIKETSGGEQPASVIYDEHWKAASAIVSSSTGVNVRWVKFSAFDDHTVATPKSRAPKMVVDKWIVHGHVHFR